MNKASVGATKVMSKEQMSGHMNDDFSAPSSTPTYKTPGPGRLRGMEENTNRGVTAKVVITDITGVMHGTVPVSEDPGGFSFKVREG